MKTTSKIILLHIAKVISLFLPLVILICLNFNQWFTFTNSGGYKVTGGFIISLIVGFLLAIGKMPKIHPVVWTLILALIVTLLEPLMRDIKVIAWVSLLGMILYSMFELPEKFFLEQYQYERQAKIEAKAMEEVFKEGSGRA